MKALLLTDDQLEIVQGALDGLYKDYEADIADNGDENGEVEDHRWTLDEVRAVEQVKPVALGGLDGVLVTFGDGCDHDTWNTVFGRISGYGIDIWNTDGDKRQGFVNTVCGDEDIFEVQAVDGDWDQLSELSAAWPFSEVAHIHIH